MDVSPIQAPADYVIEFSHVVTSSVNPTTNALQYSIPGIGEMDQANGGSINNDPDIGEGTNDADVFGQAAVLVRPLPPQTVDGQIFHLEVVCVRQTDGLTPFATRDLRLKMPGGAPNEGTVALVGYGGGFLSHSAVNGGAGGTVSLMYCPYDFDSDGNAQKAHSITLDPSAGNESISLVHALGQAMLFQNDGSVTMQSVDGQTYVKVEDGQLTLQSAQVVLNGSIFIGDPTLAAAFPLLPGAASPPCPRLFLSPI